MKHKIKTAACIAALCVAVILIFIYPEQIKQGVTDGLTMCAEVVIPSMFVFAVVANFAAESGAARIISHPFGVILSPLLKIPRNASSAVMMSFISGYPVGAAGVARLRRDGSIDSDTAERMLAICVNASPTMVIVAIGGGLLGDITLGWIMYLSHIAASLLIGSVWARFAKAPNETHCVNIHRISVAEAFVTSTADACSQMLAICTYVVLFCAIGAVCKLYAPFTAAILEVTSGAKWAVSNGISVPIISGITAFGGLSVICQVMSIARGIASPAVILFSRLANGIVTSAICTGIMRLSERDTEVISNLGTSTTQFGIVTVPATLSMLAMAATFLATVRQKS